jgi:hypothetical protein
MFMFNNAEKEELKRIINKYVEEGRCTRPIHPDEVLREISLFNQAEGCMQEAPSPEVALENIAWAGLDRNHSQADLGLSALQLCP